MSVNIVVPGFGESITEGTVAQWLKKEGEFVKKDDILLEIESEKATQGIPSPAAGVLHIQAKDGDKVEVGGVIGAIDETAIAPAAKAGAPGKSEEPAIAKESQAPAPAAEKETKLSPAARRAAAEEGVDVSKVAGTGRQIGRAHV